MNKKLLGVIGLVLAIVLVTSACTFLRFAKDAEDFVEYFKAAGFTVEDMTSKTKNDGKALAVLVAKNDDYQLEFYVLSDAVIAENTFVKNKKLLAEKKPMKELTTEEEAWNYGFYSTTDDGEFYILSRVKNTMIYGTISAEFRDEVTELVKNFGY